MSYQQTIDYLCGSIVETVLEILTFKEKDFSLYQHFLREKNHVQAHAFAYPQLILVEQYHSLYQWLS